MSVSARTGCSKRRAPSKLTTYAFEPTMAGRVPLRVAGLRKESGWAGADENSGAAVGEGVVAVAMRWRHVRGKRGWAAPPHAHCGLGAVEDVLVTQRATAPGAMGVRVGLTHASHAEREQAAAGPGTRRRVESALRYGFGE